MEKLKEFLKLFTYIFYPGVVFILYFAQILEGKLGSDLIFCPTDLIFAGIVLVIYVLFEVFKLYDKKLFKMMKREDGKLKISCLFIFIIILVFLMSLYDDLKVYFYLNNDIGVNLLIIGVIWLVLFGACYLLNKQEK